MRLEKILEVLLCAIELFALVVVLLVSTIFVVICSIIGDNGDAA